MSKKISSGVVTALVTPFKNDKIDWGSFEKLLDFQVKNGVDGFVINGTTAESPNLSLKEVKEIYNFVKPKVQGKTMIIGAGSNSTYKTIELHQEFKDLKPDAYLDVVPYYNKPTQEGLFQHFDKIASASSAPVILYNVPSRTLTSLGLEVIERLTANANIKGIKEASGDLDFMKAIKQIAPEDWTLMSGDDETGVDFVALGGDGAISVLSHLVPKTMKELFALAKTNHMEASKKFAPLLRLAGLIFVEPNPTPVKWALYAKGILNSAECRLPLLALSEKHYASIEEQLKLFEA